MQAHRVSIALAKVKLSSSDVCEAIAMMNESVLNDELVTHLLSLLPSNDEIKTLQVYCQRCMALLHCRRL